MAECLAHKNGASANQVNRSQWALFDYSTRRRCIVSRLEVLDDEYQGLVQCIGDAQFTFILNICIQPLSKWHSQNSLPIITFLVSFYGSCISGYDFGRVVNIAFPRLIADTANQTSFQ